MATAGGGAAFTGTEQVGSVSLRAEIVDKIVKAAAKPLYKFKQAVLISSTNAWKNTFFRQDPAVLTGGTGNLTKGIPRGANFPQASVSVVEVYAHIEKYGLEDSIMYEDILFNDIAMQDRTLFKLAEGVTKAVDDEIWDKLTESQSPSAIQSVTMAAGFEWDTASAQIVDDLMFAKQVIGVANIATGRLDCYISEKDHRSIVKFVTDSGAQFDKLGETAAVNGRVQGLAGMRFIVSNSVTASYALVVVPKLCATWKAAVPLQSDTQNDPFRSTRIRVVEMGVTQLHEPMSCVLMINTQS